MISKTESETQMDIAITVNRIGAGQPDTQAGLIAAQADEMHAALSIRKAISKMDIQAYWAAQDQRAKAIAEQSMFRELQTTVCCL